MKFIKWLLSIFAPDAPTSPAPAAPVPPATMIPPVSAKPVTSAAPVVVPVQPKPSNSFFTAAFNYTLGNEGGYTNDAADAGGPTNWGITIHDYSRYLGRAATAAEVRAMSKDVAEAIYKKWYWDILSLDGVNSQGVAMAMFDQGVVRGTGTIAKAVQRLVGEDDDAHIGVKTLAAINAHNPEALIQQIEAQAEQAFQAIVNSHPSQRVFLNGWMNRARRIMSLEKYA